jgi:hypothetical protein
VTAWHGGSHAVSESLASLEPPDEYGFLGTRPVSTGMLVVLEHVQMIGVQQDHVRCRRRLAPRRRSRSRSCLRIFCPAASISFMSLFPENIPTVRFQSFPPPVNPR